MKNDLNSFYENISNDFLLEYEIIRKNYIEKINSLISAHLNQQATNVLDVGCGNCMRSKRICPNATITFLDSNPKMYEFKGESEFISAPIDEYCQGKYDIILCLGNVLGHVQDKHKAIANMTTMLNPQGLLFLDVHNRYNISQYGLRAVIRNISVDIIKKPNRGIFPLGSGKVYIHNPLELDRTFDNLEIIEKQYVHYETGEITNIFGGQIFYMLQKLN